MRAQMGPEQLQMMQLQNQSAQMQNTLMQQKIQDQAAMRDILTQGHNEQQGEPAGGVLGQNGQPSQTTTPPSAAPATVQPTPSGAMPSVGGMMAQGLDTGNPSSAGILATGLGPSAPPPQPAAGQPSPAGFTPSALAGPSGNPGTPGAFFDRILQLAANNKQLSPQGYMELQSSVVQMRKNALDLDEKTAQIQQKHSELFANSAYYLAQLAKTDPAALQAQYPAEVNRLTAAGAIRPDEAKTMLAMGTPSVDTLNRWGFSATSAKAQADIALDHQKNQQEFDKAGAEDMMHAVIGARGDDDMATIRQQQKAMGRRQELIDAYAPPKYSADLAQRYQRELTPAANLSNEPGEVAESNIKAASDAASTLVGAQRVGELNKRIAGLNPSIQGRFKALGDPKDFTNMTPLTAQDRQDIQNAALTPEQKTRMAEVAESNRLRAAAIGVRENSPTQQKLTQQQTVESLANRVLSESTQNGGRGLDDAISNATKFYQDDPDMQKYRGQVIAQLNQWKKTPNTGKGNTGQSLLQVGSDGKLHFNPNALQNNLSGGKPSGNPGAETGARQTTNPPPRTANLGRTVTVMTPSGPMSFANEAAAQSFEQHVKSAGGNTWRQPPSAP